MTTVSGMPDGWRKSSYSGNQGNCVMIRDDNAAIGDTKNPTGPALEVGREQLRAFLAAIRES